MHITHKAFIISSAFSVLLCAFLSLNVSAVDTIIDISNYEVIRSTATPKISCKFNNSALDATNVGICGGFTTSGNASSVVQLQRIYSYDSYSFQPGDIIEYDVLVYGEDPSNFADGAGNGYGFLMKNGTMSDYPFRVLSIKQNLHDDMINLGGIIQNNNLAPAQTTRWYYTTYHYELIYVGPNNGSYQLGWTSGYSTLFEYMLSYYYFRIENFIQYRPGDDPVVEAIRGQSQQQQNQYDQEKQEESQRESQANGDSNSAQGLFNFNVLNPFANLWNAFNSSGCVSIPTIANMLHSNNTSYCPWFPSSVRSVVTPVMAIASSMLLFGFVVRWLSGNSGDIYGARNMNKELNG